MYKLVTKFLFSNLKDYLTKNKLFKQQIIEKKYN